MPTLILTSRYSEDAQSLWRAATVLGWNVERLLNWRLSDELKLVTEPVLYVEALMSESIAEQLGLQLLEGASDWLPNVPNEYRKRWIYLSTLGEVRHSRITAFVKPPNDKSFSASVYNFTNLPIDYPDETLVLVAEIVQWEKEFRCFVLNRTLQTFSIYLRDGELQSKHDFFHTEEEEDEVLDFITKILSDDRIKIPQATVIDIGIIHERGWAIVEQNAAWGSGLYGCDPIRVLEVLRYASVVNRI
jgi:ATP-grasp domain, R2K clade family 2